MPEAVNSHTIPVSDVKPDDIEQLFELTANMAYALIDRMITARLERRADRPIQETGKVTIWPELFQRIAEIVTNAYADHGVGLPEPGQGNPTSMYYNQVLRKLEGSRDPLEAGSLLPWIEMRIRHDANAHRVADQKDDDFMSLRDRIVSEKIREGVTAADLSQAFNMKRAAIDRIIGRLNGLDAQRKTG